MNWDDFKRYGIEFSEDRKVEFGNLKRSRTASIMGAYEGGARLLFAKADKRFLEFENENGERPSDFTEFLIDFARLPPGTAYRYMDCATWPREPVILYGIDAMSTLRRICNMTEVDETPEQALALELPLEGGGSKVFTQMNSVEVETAYRLMKEGRGRAKRSGQVPPAPPMQADPKVTGFRGALADALAPIMKDKQVQVAREANGDYVLDLKKIPLKSWSDFVAAISRLMFE